MITVPRTLKTKPKNVSNQESDIQWLIIDKYFLDLRRNELGLRVRLVLPTDPNTLEWKPEKLMSKLMADHLSHS
jgi:hypothetical protein